MSKIYFKLKWWQWAVVLVYALSSLARSPAQATLAGQLGGVVGALVGSYLLMLALVAIGRGIQRKRSTKSDAR